jgi:hypothetical protein
MRHLDEGDGALARRLKDGLPRGGRLLKLGKAELAELVPLGGVIG